MGDAPKLHAAIIIVSETASKDPSTDKCIPALQDVFSNDGAGRFEADDTVIVSDDALQIQRAITQRTDGDDFVNLIVTSGGTGFTQKDVTPEVCLLTFVRSQPWMAPQLCVSYCRE
jgi:gephyrin